MEHRLYNSIDEMLAPETLSELEGRPITDVRLKPFGSELSRSGSRFLAVETNEGQGPRYILKRIAPEWDWLMLATEDHLCRSVTVWQYGLLDRLRPEVEHGIVASAKAGSGWAILMRDLTEGLIPEDQPLSIADNERVLRALAAQHAAFWEAPELTNPKVGLCNLSGLFKFLLPEMGHRKFQAVSVIPHRLVEGWELLQRLVEPDVVEVLRKLMMDPQPLCDALARYPQTLVHGDPQSSNMSFMHSQQTQVVILDWQLAAMGSATIDLAWYLHGGVLPISREAAIEYYRQNLAQRLGDRFDKGWWQPLLELGLLGNMIRAGCFLAWHATHDKNEKTRARCGNELVWLSKQVRAGVRWL